MSRFTSTKVINSRWRNNDFIGAAGSSHTFPDAFHDEFLVDWAQQIADGSIIITETPTTGNIQMATLTVGDIVLTGTATGDFGTGGSTNASVLQAYVKNSTGTTLTKGQVVYVSGSDGANALISLSTASTEVGSSKTLGLLAQTLTTGSQGYVIENGLLTDIDTSAATAGQAVWLGNTPGSFVFGSPPAEPSNSVYLGVVTRVQQNNGEILVKVQNGYEIDELHDVSAASPSNGDIIQYKTSSGMWTNQTLSQAGVVQSSTVTAKGDLIVASGASAVTRLGAGTDGYILTARSSATNGLAWEANSGGGVTSVTGTAPIVSSGGTTPAISISAASTSASGAVQLTDSANSTSTSTAATANAVLQSTKDYQVSVYNSTTRIGNLPNWFITANSNHASGTVSHTRHIPERNFTVSNISFIFSATTSGLTLARFGIYTRSGTTFTLVARTASDTTIGNTINTRYTRALDTTGGYPATYDFVAGNEYWVSIILVGTTVGSTVAGATMLSTAGATIGYTLYTQASQTDLPTSSTGSVTTAQRYSEVS